MKKSMLLSLGVFTLFLMSVTSKTDKIEDLVKYPIRTHICPNGYEFDHYYNVPGWTEKDYTEMQDIICNDPDNTPEITPTD